MLGDLFPGAVERKPDGHLPLRVVWDELLVDGSGCVGLRFAARRGKAGGRRTGEWWWSAVEGRGVEWQEFCPKSGWVIIYMRSRGPAWAVSDVADTPMGTRATPYLLHI